MGNEQEEYLDNYIANRFTMAILPEVHKGRLYSRVIEVEKELFVKLSPQDIVNRSCSYFGSSYEGLEDMGVRKKEKTYKKSMFVTVSFLSMISV
ncbi:competence protein ComK [Metabacillus dongyingensis]|uniref:competence protein ComK n=1 Tax=Metabacillus dongyingensis TaxID=2874282 RepID=UPI003B8CCD7F